MSYFQEIKKELNTYINFWFLLNPTKTILKDKNYRKGNNGDKNLDTREQSGGGVVIHLTDPRKLNQTTVGKSRRKLGVIKFTLPYSLRHHTRWHWEFLGMGVKVGHKGLLKIPRCTLHIREHALFLSHAED